MKVARPDARETSNEEVRLTLNLALSGTRIELLPSGPEDLSYLLELHALAMRESVEQEMGWDERFQKFRLRRSFNPDHLLIVTHGADRIGTLTLVPRTYGRHGDNFYLRPEWQGKGVGERIMRALLDYGDEQGWEFRCGVIRGGRVRRLYERLGFEWHRASEHEDKMRRLPQRTKVKGATS